MTTASSGNTPVNADQYDVSFYIPCPDGPAFIKGTIPVVALDLLAPANVHALIGRDVLGECMLIYDGKNQFFSIAY